MLEYVSVSLSSSPQNNSTSWVAYSYSPLRHRVAKYFAWNHTRLSGGTLILTQAVWLQSPSTDPPDLITSCSWGCWGHPGRWCRWSTHHGTSPRSAHMGRLLSWLSIVIPWETGASRWILCWYLLDFSLKKSEQNEASLWVQCFLLTKLTVLFFSILLFIQHSSPNCT